MNHPNPGGPLSDIDSSEAPLDVMIEVLACVAQADGVVCDSEIETARSILTDISPNDVSKIRVLYQSALKYYSRTERQQNLGKLICTLPLHQRLSVLRTLWAFALCDGEIHQSEQTMILDLMQQCGIDNALADFAAADGLVR